MAEMQELVGQEVVGFELVSLLGQGGMAAVFKGQNLLDRTITRAIKVVHPELAARPEFTRRFAEEAHVLEQLQHPNVVRFFGVRREGNHLVMELEYLEGLTIEQELEKHRQNRSGETPEGLPLDLLVEWIRQASLGVAAAPAHKIVHRDLKPENIFRCTDGTIKVLDFGIARAMDEADRQAKATRAGTVPGTPAYMAPEVCDGASPSEQADVYSLGLTLYQLCLGHHPYLPPGAKPLSDVQLMFAQVTKPLNPLREFRPDASVALEQVLARATAKDPRERFTSAQELSDALHGVSSGQVPTAGKEKTRLALPTFQSMSSEGSTGNVMMQGSVRVTTDPANVQKPKGRKPLWLFAALGLPLVAGGAWWMLKEPPKKKTSTEDDSEEEEVTAEVETVQPMENSWVRMDPPRSRDPVYLGTGSDKADYGFNKRAKVVVPDAPYEIMQHEVTWSELDPWLESRPDRHFIIPEYVSQDDEARRELPVTGVPWETANAYCLSTGGMLPTEEQWEFAARGPSLRPFSWGPQAIDPAGTNAFKDEDWSILPVKSSHQDRTPGESDQILYDMMGNAREWTADLYRMNGDGKAAVWVTMKGQTIRALRGLPLKPPTEDIGTYSIPEVGAAWRAPRCGSGPCMTNEDGSPKVDLDAVGFRCARAADVKKGY